MLYKLIFFFLITKFIFLIIISNVDLNENEKAYNIDLLCNCPVGFIKPRVVNGTRISRDDFKWLVSLYSLKDNETFCTGSILNENTILTAGHCLKFDTSFNDTYVLAGSVDNVQLMAKTEANRRRIKKFFIHPSFELWQNDPYLFDAAIAILEEPFELGPKYNIYPACFFSEQILKPESFVFYLAGFGIITPIKFSFITYEKSHVIVPNESYYLELENSENCGKYSNDHYFCLRSDHGSACYADSGAPVHINYHGKALQVGILVWGKPNHEVHQNTVCYPGSVSLAAKITEVLCWLKSLGNPICLEN